MNQPYIIQHTRAMLEEKFSEDSSGHDWWHIYRVWQLADRIAIAEGADQFVVSLAALLHDIADWKFNDGDLSAGSTQARAWLESLDVDTAIIDHICEIVDHISFKGAGVKSDMQTLEGKVVQDADRLDAIGAIGIGRTFAYGGYAGRLMYDPHEPSVQHDSFEAYKNNKGTTINHFYEKLLLLKDRMNTDTGKQIAADRHAFLETFLQRFLKEWDGEL